VLSTRYLPIIRQHQSGFVGPTARAEQHGERCHALFLGAARQVLCKALPRSLHQKQFGVTLLSDIDKSHEAE